MIPDNKNLYENGCACVRWFGRDRHYEVLYSPDGDTKKTRSEMFLVGWYEFDSNSGENKSSEMDISPAKALCDLWRVPPEKMIDRDPVVYENGCASVVRDDRRRTYKIRIKNWKETTFLDGEFEDESYNSYKFVHGEKSEDEALVKAKKICDEMSRRDDGRTINEKYYPDFPYEFPCWGVCFGFFVFLLYWIGFAIKSNLPVIVDDGDVRVVETIIFFFTGSGLDFLAEHWWQVGLLVLVSILIGYAFWMLGKIHKFSLAYRIFVRAFGKIQAACTAFVWGLVALYWAIIGLWRSIISPLPDALGYPHFIAATIYLAVIVWGIVDFMKYRKQPARSTA